MLVLSRRVGETILIGDEIKVTVLNVTGKQVRIGIAAPDAMNIVREEIAGKKAKRDEVVVNIPTDEEVAQALRDKQDAALEVQDAKHAHKPKNPVLGMKMRKAMAEKSAEERAKSESK